MVASSFLNAKFEMKEVPSLSFHKTDEVTKSFLRMLEEIGFRGEATCDLADRVVCSTDNSIYQVMPQAVVYPRAGDDLTLLMQVAQRPEFKDLKFFPRGGGTSTNGQSLGNGVIVDTSRFMCRILDYDEERGLVRVEPGLVRDKLLAFLKPYGRFFAPHVSTTSRATLGGMVSNDSSGKGSVVYGKTSDHIHSIEFVLPNGAVAELGQIAVGDLRQLSEPVAELARNINRILAPRFEDIGKRFPELKRGFTGYNLKETLKSNGDLNLAKLVAGAEGTLGFIKSITLHAEPIPAHTYLVVLLYPSHDAGLRAVPDLLEFKPHAIEFVDDKILAAALKSPFSDDVKEVLGIDGSGEAVAAQFFEMSDDEAGNLEQRLTSFLTHLNNLSARSLRPSGVKVLKNAQQIAKVWEVRRACQGLLAGFDRNKRAVAFIEDCAVPPENLADFVGELEALLQSKNIPLGMYGHADVGCVHIRPLMNLNVEDERLQIREISDAVFELTQKYGGLLWGEHGKGLRGEYSQKVIGQDLYNAMREIKGVFDPLNRMNAGKIAAPENAKVPLLVLDGVPMRGEFDEQISPVLSHEFSNSLRCDGNGSCFNQDNSLAFCPSYKATGDRRQSPKGRSGLLREWIRFRSRGCETDARTMAEELNDILSTCLACKACAGAACPVRVDIPQLKSQFLDWFHQEQRRPLSDVLVSNLERIAPFLDLLSKPLNALQSTRLAKSIMSKWFGLVDLPAVRSRSEFENQLRKLQVKTLSATELMKIKASQRAETVVIVQDCFTSFYDADVVVAQVKLVQKLGYRPVLLSYREGGKPLHVRGMLDRFRRVAKRNAHELAMLSKAGFTLLGVDGATTLMYRHEYPETFPECPEFSVFLLSEWLEDIELPSRDMGKSYTLVQHCTERSLVPETSNQWRNIFRRMGFDVHIVKTGCCGMSGLFGHEVPHQRMSATLYDRNWRDIVEANAGRKLVATGYSCRSQIQRFSHIKPRHPAQALLEFWEN
jgi:FAD/FMN-containing dehydrogenase/Fe-S oxidoreductase